MKESKCEEMVHLCFITVVFVQDNSVASGLYSADICSSFHFQWLMAVDGL